MKKYFNVDNQNLEFSEVSYIYREDETKEDAIQPGILVRDADSEEDDGIIIGNLAELPDTAQDAYALMREPYSDIDFIDDNGVYHIH